MADIKTPAERSENMSKIRSRNTKPELYIRKELFARGYRYRVAPSYIPGHPDLFLRKHNLAVFVHGCFWHRHAGCKYAYTPKSRVDFWNHKFDSNVHRDQEVVRQLNDERIRCLVIWECAIRKALMKNGNPAELFRRIEEAILSGDPYTEVTADCLLGKVADFNFNKVFFGGGADFHSFSSLWMSQSGEKRMSQRN